MIEKNNTKPFEVMKFLGLVAMVLAHCFIFLYRVYPEYKEIMNLNFIHRFAYFNGLYSMTLPALAGVFLYEKMKNHLRGQFLTNVDVSRYLKPIGILFIMESFKNAFIFGWESFFRWDVLHFISISLVIMVFLLIKWGIRSFYFILIISIVSVFLLSYFNAQRWLYHANQNSTFISYIFGCALFLMILYLVLNKLIKINKVISFALLSITFYILIINYENIQLYLIVSNYPLSIIVQLGQNGGHIWPLFPWMNCLLIGFLLARFMNEIPLLKWQIFILMCFFQIPIIYLLFFSLESYQALLSKNDFFSSMFFSPHWLLFLLLNIFFVAAAFSFDFLFKIKSFSIDSITVINQYILPIYFTHIAVVWKIAGPLTQLFPIAILKWLYPVIVIFLTYCFIQLFLLASDKMIWFRLRKTHKR